MTPTGQDEIWSALPMPGVLVDAANCITAVTPAGEVFLNVASKALEGRELRSVLRLNVNLADSIARVREGRSALFHRDVQLDRDGQGIILCDLQIAPVSVDPDVMMVLLHPRQIAGKLGRAEHLKSVTKTAIGLADMLAHEIKNPLAGIVGAAQLLAMNLSAQDQEMTDLILQETRRIVALLQQVEQFGDLRPPKLRPINVHDLLERARKSASLGAAAHMRFFDDYDPSLPNSMGDADQLLQVFANLFANAAQAGGDGGRITIRTYFEQGLRLSSGRGDLAVPLQIEVIDDGPGIPEALADSVFDPFVSTRENGTGLGLALVSKIITEHNGTIVLTSKPGRTSFRISLPIAPKNAGETI
ncbi:MAG: ATP-binding protein [Proteobacteria bacterium]|nr:ATP-binding protein [Pseudomonadota bacterium]MDA1285443.1 ATP-binding protein [Pseudomonadota bacterium]